jgi:hypothetical protein
LSNIRNYFEFSITTITRAIFSYQSQPQQLKHLWAERQLKRVKSPKFPDDFILAPPLLFKSGLAVIAPLSGRTVKSTVGESFSF